MKKLVKVKHEITKYQLYPLNFNNALGVNGEGKCHVNGTHTEISRAFIGFWKCSITSINRVYKY